MSLARTVTSWLGLACLIAGSSALLAQEPRSRTIVKSTYDRLVFDKRVTRLAVADENIVKMTELSKYELLALGVEIGRTSAVIWFEDGESLQLSIAVELDLTVLRGALLDIDPSIRVESAPDRDAIVLRGEVQDVGRLRAAEAAARDYLDAGGARSSAAQPLVRAGGVSAPGAETVRVPEGRFARAALINLIRVRQLPARLDERLQRAIVGLGARDVTIRRVQRGELPNDEEDVFILEGEVANQVVLTRVLTTASRAVLGSGQQQSQNRVRVVADESGGLANANGNANGNRGGGGGGGGGGGFGGGGGGLGGGQLGGGTNINLTNDVQINLGRAKVVEVAGGRILSFINVRDLPQVAVGIKLYEINRTRLRNIGSDLGLISSDFDQPALLPGGTASTLQGGSAASVGSIGATDLQNALGFLGGGLTNQLQLVTGSFALDAVLSVLEANDIARKLSEPTMTVLSGEQAIFQVGGEIPVPQAFAPDAGQGLAQGVFSSVEFVSFGVQLGVRPLVGEEDEITLDLIPQVINPDPTLTLLVGSTTGSNVPTTAFETRTLRTTNRVMDGQALVLGGLVNRTRTRELAETPGLSDIPLLQWLFRDFSANDEEIELVIIVHPAILRDPIPEAALWEFPSTQEMLQTLRDAGRLKETEAFSGTGHPERD